MKKETKRNVVMVVGATGSLGKAVVTEFNRVGGVPRLRLLGRSWKSFVEAGYIEDERSNNIVNNATMYNKNLELVVCQDVQSRIEYHDKWFTDVKVVVCVARPRALIPEDFALFEIFIQNLCDVVCVNHVPRLMLHGMPFVEEFPFGMTESMIARQGAEERARNRFRRDCSSSSHLTISRISEMSEFGHLLEFSRAIRVWLCVRGHDPRMQPISAHDFALAVVRFAENNTDYRQDLLVGGPQIVKWRELGSMISTAIERRLITIAIPLSFLKIWFGIMRYAKRLLPFLEGLENVVRLVVTPMMSNTTNDNFDTIGDDDLETFLRDHAVSEHATYVRKRIFRSPKRD